jgi:hypothetical protein
MDRFYREGWTGHCEVTWATLLHTAGLRIADLGGNGEFVAAQNRGRFYENTMTSLEHSPGTFVYRPMKLPWPRLRRNMLWHPVKPLDLTIRTNLQARYWEFHRKLRRTLRERRGLFGGRHVAP